MKSFGMFSIIRGILRAIMGLFGGVMAKRVSIRISYIILAIYPVVMMLYTLFIFKEHSVKFIQNFIKLIFFRNAPGLTVC
jgi:hypothetical protein